MKDDSKEIDIKNDKNNKVAIIKYRTAPQIVAFLSFFLYPTIIFYLAYQLKNNDFITYLNRFLAFSFISLCILLDKIESFFNEKKIDFFGHNLSKSIVYASSFLFLSFCGFLMASVFLMFVFI